MAIPTGDDVRTMHDAYRMHPRQWRDARYVYPVVSRRSGGLSIGINLSPGKECSFHCLYCQVDRRNTAAPARVDPARLQSELEAILGEEQRGRLYDVPPFGLLPLHARGVRDIAFSGDGEPTASPDFPKGVGIAARARLRFGLGAAKIVLITNASLLDRPRVRRALEVLDRNNGEVWAKLDAGTETYFRTVNRSPVPLAHILGNILDAARARSVVIQSIWMRLGGAAPAPREIEAYCDRLNGILASGGRLKALHLYTIARTPGEPCVSALEDDALDRIADTVRSRVPVPAEVFYQTGTAT